MANATSQNKYIIKLTRSQLELLEKMLSQEIALLESGYAHPNPQILKRTFDAVWQHLKPSPEEKLKRMQSWIKQIYGKRTADVNLVKAA